MSFISRVLDGTMCDNLYLGVRMKKSSFLVAYLLVVVPFFTCSKERVSVDEIEEAARMMCDPAQLSQNNFNKPIRVDVSGKNEDQIQEMKESLYRSFEDVRLDGQTILLSIPKGTSRLKDSQESKFKSCYSKTKALLIKAHR